MIWEPMMMVWYFIIDPFVSKDTDCDRIRTVGVCFLACCVSKPVRSPVDGPLARLAHDPGLMGQAGSNATDWCTRPTVP